LIFTTALIAIPIGVLSGVYFEEYSKKNRLHHWLEVNLNNLAGVPSIIYGLLGLTIFVRTLGLGRSILAGALTLSLLVLPIIIISTRQAIRAVPSGIRHAAFALGASRWQTVWGQILPASLPGIMTGIILSVSRALGETAPIVMIGALSYVAYTPDGFLDSFTTLPIQIFNWASRPAAAFHELAAAAIVVLLFVLFALNAIAVTIRHRSQRKVPW